MTRSLPGALAAALALLVGCGGGQEPGDVTGDPGRVNVGRSVRDGAPDGVAEGGTADAAGAGPDVRDGRPADVAPRMDAGQPADAVAGDGAPGSRRDGPPPIDKASSPACLACQKANVAQGNCEDRIGCENLKTGAGDVAACNALYDCMARTGCWTSDPLTCLCGTALGTQCLTSASNGVCKAEVAAATKSNDPQKMGPLFYSLETGAAGHATQQMACRRDFCQAECTNDPIGDAGAPGSGDAGGPPPTAPTTPPTMPAVDALPPAADTGMGPPPAIWVPTAACLACEKLHIESDPDMDEGTRCEGPLGCESLAGADRTLCEAALACMRRTRCWLNDPLDCLCGSAQGTTCATPAANGACKAELQAAAKTSDPVAIGTRLFEKAARPPDPPAVLPSGYAAGLIACDYNKCKADCSVNGAGGGTAPPTAVDVAPPAPSDAGVAMDAPLPMADAAVARPDIAPVPDLAAPAGGTAARAPQCLACEQEAVATGLCEEQIGCARITTGAADVALCEALSACMRSTGCWQSDPLDCLCGSASGTACASAAANGVCKAEIQAATKTTDPVANGTLFYSFTVPAGFATQQAACDRDNCKLACSAAPPGTPPAAPPPIADAAAASDLSPAPTADAIGPVPGPSLASNGGFDRDAAGWTAEFAATQSHDARDASGRAGSGALLVGNRNVLAGRADPVMAGTRQCLPVGAGARLDIEARTLVDPASAGVAAGVGALFFDGPDCAGVIEHALVGPLSAAASFTLVRANAVAPPGARSVAIRLVVQKPFSHAPATALFDDVHVKDLRTP